MVAAPIIKGLTKALAKNVKGGLSSLDESLKITPKSSDLVTHTASVSNLPSIAKEGLRYGTHVEIPCLRLVVAGDFGLSCVYPPSLWIVV